MSRRLRTRLRAGTGLAVTSLNLEFATAAGGLDPRITFSRGSQATLTDSTGQLTYAPNNLLTNSESFEAAAWAKTNATVTANTVAAPDGTTTADTLAATNANATALQTFTATGATYVYSVYIRRKTGTGNIDITVDGTTYATKSVTSSWVRYDTLLTPAAGSKTAGVRIATSGDEVYIWGAQLEAVTYQTTPSPYVSTTPKNLLGYTQEFDNAAWTKSNATAYPFDPATATQGPELVTNGDFSGGSTGWTLGSGWSVSGGVATFDPTGQAANSDIYYTLPSAKDSVATYDVSANGAFSVILAVTAGGAIKVTGTVSGRTAGTIRILSASGRIYIRALNGTGFNGSIDNISAKELSGGLITAPDGSLTADKLVENNANAIHYAAQAPTLTSGVPYVLSFYAKAAERSWCYIANSSDTFNAYVNLSTGAVGTVTGSGVTATAVAAGNDWWRVTLSFAAGSSAAKTLYIASATGNGAASYTGDGTSGIYIWGAQLSNSASVDPYVYNPVAAPSSTAYYGPRFDYDPVTLAPKGLLIEEQRTNLLLRSEEFDNASWAKTGVTVTPNAALAPDNTVSADAIIPNLGSTTSSVSQTISASTVTGSVFAKAAGFQALELDFAVAGARVEFDLQNGVVASAPANWTCSISSVGNGWYRCVAKPDIAVTRMRVYVKGTGDGTSGIYIWGAQLEAGAFATSYIPTVASTVTRSADVALMQGANFSNWYNQSAGTFLVEFTPNTVPVAGLRTLSFNDGTASNRIISSPALTSHLSVTTGGAMQVNINAGNPTAGATNKVSGAYATNDFAASLNGGAVMTDTSGTVPTVTRLDISNENGINQINGWVRSIQYYNTRLSNAQLQALTS